MTMEGLHYATLAYTVHLDVTQTAHWDSEDHEFHTIMDCPQRAGDGFGTYLTELAGSSGADITVDHYTGAFQEPWPAMGHKGDADQYNVTIAGTRDQIESYISSVAEEGYGLPTIGKVMTDRSHPFKSLAGWRDSIKAIKAHESDAGGYSLSSPQDDGTKVITRQFGPPDSWI